MLNMNIAFYLFIFGRIQLNWTELNALHIFPLNGYERKLAHLYSTMIYSLFWFVTAHKWLFPFTVFWIKFAHFYVPFKTIAISLGHTVEVVILYFDCSQFIFFFSRMFHPRVEIYSVIFICRCVKHNWYSTPFHKCLLNVSPNLNIHMSM